jgi:subtilase family serine protease
MVSGTDHAAQLQVPEPIPPHSGYAAIAARSPKTVNFPDVELPVGTAGATVKFTPSQAWGTADLMTNVTALRQRFGVTGKGIKIGIIDR